MKIAVEGCCHGELDKIYDTIVELQKRDNIKVDLLLCCGDFQAVRNEADLNCMAVPVKYRKMNTFYKALYHFPVQTPVPVDLKDNRLPVVDMYYSGEKKAPVLTIFIGGNHEASNHLWELGYGGWVAPNIYYLGYSGVVQYGGIRIAGLSGIYKYHDYERGHHEQPPYNGNTVRSTYHVRSFDVFKLNKMSCVDIGMSHDWPRGIYHHGNTGELLRSKPFFRDEVNANTLGSPPAEQLLMTLRPQHWFSAHLHCRFEANFNHCSSTGEVECTTKFLALDKCLPRRCFLEVIDIPHSVESPLELCYDPDWLLVTKATSGMFPSKPQRWVPPLVMDDHKNTPEMIEEMKTAFGGSFKIPENFQQTVKCYDPSQRINYHAVVIPTINPQTQEFCDKLGIANPFVPMRERTASAARVSSLTWLGSDSVDPGDHQDQIVVNTNPDRINIDSDDDGDTITTDTPTALTPNDNDFLPLDATETHPLDTTETHPLDTTDTAENRKRLHNNDNNSERTVVIKRRNASLYQSQDNDTDNNPPHVYHDY